MFLGFLAANTTAAGEVKNGLAEKIAGFFDFVIGRVPSWIAGFLVFVISIFIAKIAKAAVESRISSQIDEEHQEVLVLAGRVTYFGTLILGITIGLKIAGIDLTTILAAVAFGIGFALKDLIMNFLAGVLILLGRQFTIGDFIKVGSTVGRVMEIQTRATILKGVDGTKVIVPNAEIFRSQVVSYTTNATRRVTIDIFVSYDTEIQYATKVALATIKKHPKVLKKPPPSVVVKGYGDSTIDMVARFWVGSRDGWVKVKSDLTHEFLVAFDEAGIVIPYNVTHIETDQDTAEHVKGAAEIRKQKQAEAKLSKAIAEDNGQASQNGQMPAQTGEPQPAIPILPIPQQIAQEHIPVTVEPEGVYQDMEEIDEQA